MSVSSTPSTVPPAPVPLAAQPAHDAAPQPAPAPASEPRHAPAPVPDVPNPSASAPAPFAAAIGFSLQYDPESGRMFLEAREPVSGFVIFQMPPKYVIKQFSASIGRIEPARGAKVDSAA